MAELFIQGNALAAAIPASRAAGRTPLEERIALRAPRIRQEELGTFFAGAPKRFFPFLHALFERPIRSSKDSYHLYRDVNKCLSERARGKLVLRIFPDGTRAPDRHPMGQVPVFFTLSQEVFDAKRNWPRVERDFQWEDCFTKAGNELIRKIYFGKVGTKEWKERQNSFREIAKCVNARAKLCGLPPVITKGLRTPPSLSPEFLKKVRIDDGARQKLESAFSENVVGAINFLAKNPISSAKLAAQGLGVSVGCARYRMDEIEETCSKSGLPSPFQARKCGNLKLYSLAPEFVRHFSIDTSNFRYHLRSVFSEGQVLSIKAISEKKAARKGELAELGGIHACNLKRFAENVNCRAKKAGFPEIVEMNYQNARIVTYQINPLAKRYFHELSEEWGSDRKELGACLIATEIKLVEAVEKKPWGTSADFMKAMGCGSTSRVNAIRKSIERKCKNAHLPAPFARFEGGEGKKVRFAISSAFAARFGLEAGGIIPINFLLAAREREAFGLMRSGASWKEIKGRMGLSTRDEVSKHYYAINRKLRKYGYPLVELGKSSP